MPLFAIHCLDKPDVLALRLDTRAAHVAHLDSQGERVALAGPLLDSDGTTMIGSLLVIDFTDLAAAQTWANNDPYALAGVFASTSVREFRKTRPMT